MIQLRRKVVTGVTLNRQPGCICLRVATVGPVRNLMGEMYLKQCHCTLDKDWNGCQEAAIRIR